MKLNFLKVLNNQNNTPEEIAEQIVALEQKQIEYQKQRDVLRQQTKELRQKKLCGEIVSEPQIADADRRVENANLDLEAVAESIAKLNDKLRKTYEAIIENGQAVAGQKIKAIELEHDRLTEELARAIAKVLVIAEQLWGVGIISRLKDSSVFDDDPKTDQIMKDEADKLRSSVKEPTYYSKFRQAESYSSWTSGININDEMSSILEKHRAKMDVPVKEMV
jgi:hypothetical protein